jgi:hypothetical protein
MDKDKREQERLKSKLTARRKHLVDLLGRYSGEKGLLLAAISFFTAVLLTPSFTVIHPSYRLGDVADRNIKAKRDFLIEDAEATRNKREEALRLAPLVYDLDEQVLEEGRSRLEMAFQTARRLLPDDASQPAPSATLAHRSQEVFASNGEPAWLAATADPIARVLERKGDFETPLQTPVADEVYLTFYQDRFSEASEKAAVHLLQSAYQQGIVGSKAILSEAQGKDILVKKIRSQEEQYLPPPHSFTDTQEAAHLVRLQAFDITDETRNSLSLAALVTGLLQPNLTFNRYETERRREQADSSVKPVYVQIKANEMLVREGQVIGPEELLKLGAHEKGKRTPHVLVIFVTIFAFSLLSIWGVVQVSRHHLPSYSIETQDLLFLGILLLLILIVGRTSQWVVEAVGEGSPLLSGKTLIHALPVAAGAMLVSIFFGVTVSLIFSLLATIFLTMLFGKDFSLFFYFLLGSFAAAHGVTPCRNRMVPIKAGLLVGGTNVVLLLLNAFLNEPAPSWSILISTVFGFSGGVFAGILVTGLTPLAEMAFNYTTDIKLLELATMDQPLLQELMVQAPGTYHHSIILGNMVEAAAKSIGANSLLAKVAAYYHDIGKIKKPLYFIENQFDCCNRHEKLAPSMSSLILISHVKDGIELARQHRLGKAIIAIISQHHGTSLISYFYKKAQESRDKAKSSKGTDLPPINIDDYRYPGPKPQTKEAGLVMLADVVEAACRSLTEPTPARIQGMVNRLINNVFSDGQLEECELTLKDLHHIAKHFNQILATVHHKRIEYPAHPATDAKGKNDVCDPNQREAKQDRDRPAAAAEGGPKNLKRLGLH